MGQEQRSLHYELTVLYQVLMGTGTWPSALKAALNLIGQPAGVPRDPVMPLAGADLDNLKRTLDQVGLLANDGTAHQPRYHPRVAGPVPS